MKVLGLCGGSGSGKGVVCQLFSDFNIASIDTDAVYHNLTSTSGACLDEIISEFGEGVVSNGSLNRIALSLIVFSDKDQLKKLNSITHKHILEKVREQICDYAKLGYRGVLVDAPLLFESGFDAECDLTLCVCADKDLRIERIMKRDGISREKALVRIDSQLPDDYLRDKCDYVIENSSTADALKKQVADIVKQIFDNSI